MWRGTEWQLIWMSLIPPLIHWPDPQRHVFLFLFFVSNLTKMLKHHERKRKWNYRSPLSQKSSVNWWKLGQVAQYTIIFVQAAVDMEDFKLGKKTSRLSLMHFQIKSLALDPLRQTNITSTPVNIRLPTASSEQCKWKHYFCPTT